MRSLARRPSGNDAAPSHAEGDKVWWLVPLTGPRGSWDLVCPGLVDQLAEPFEIGSPAGAAGVTHVGGDVTAGELEMGLAERGEGLERLIVRDLVDLAARVGETFDLRDQRPMLARHEPAHVGQVVGQHR